MRSLSSLFAVLLLSAPLWAQSVVIDATGGAPGKYWVEVTIGASGDAVARVVDNVVVIGDGNVPVPPADPGDPPADPGDLSTIGAVSYSAKSLVDDRDKGINQQKLAIVYEQIGLRIGTDFQPKAGNQPWQDLASVTSAARDAVLGRSVDEWSPWTARVGSELASMESGGKLDTSEEMAKAYRDIAAGLRHDPGNVAEEINPMWIELIMKIVMMILENFLS